jgi:hypothetical protein
MNDLSFDLQGADKIASFLGLQDRRQIYKILENRRLGKTTIPIWNEPGIGVVSCKALLTDHIQQQAKLVRKPDVR